MTIRIIPDTSRFYWILVMAGMVGCWLSNENSPRVLVSAFQRLETHCHLPQQQRQQRFLLPLTALGVSAPRVNRSNQNNVKDDIDARRYGGGYDDDDDDQWNVPLSPRRPPSNNGPVMNDKMNNNNRSQRNSTPRNQDRTTRTPARDFDLPIEIDDDNTASIDTSHFFSKKPLSDPTFRSSKADDGNDNHDDAVFESLCRGAGISRPSRIQALAWPRILDGAHTIVADQTGSGKTLGYLIPLLQRTLKSKEPKMKGAPKLLVLAPTAELADQIQSVCSKLSLQAPFKTMVITASGKYTTTIRDQIRMIQREPMDILISTPGRLSTILRTRNSGLDLSQLHAIVLDEVDILMVDETFGPQLRAVGEAASLDKTQFVFVTATLPDSVVKKVEKEFPGVVQVRGPGLHRVAPTVKERLVDVSVPPQSNRDPSECFDIKAKELLKALRQNRCRRTLIFCNTVESCRRVENLLSRSDRRGRVFEVGSYHNAMTPSARNGNMDRFSNGRQSAGGGDEEDETGRFPSKRYDNSNGKNRKKEDDVDYVLICTDRAARGADFDAAPVDHVVIFDFPKDPAEYVRRVGRTARAGRTGATTVFAYGWQLPVARQVMGSKLDSFTIAADDLEKEEDGNGFSEEYRSRRGSNSESSSNNKNVSRKQSRTKDSMIKGNIEGGRLWDGK
jgi:ATP-dependent RNA helicase DDX18/HAS1